ncbi:methyltransferase domain-containing protein [bacterium]|nr:methyltransferase domain-containing protein [bacterium]
MKTVQQLKQALPEQFDRMIKFDKREIDNPDVYHHARLNYLDRLYKTLAVFRARFSKPEEILVADIGCAQGNLSLLLAEAGFRVTALDIDPDYLAYAEKKYEKGNIQWVQGSFDKQDLPGFYDVVVLGEIIEHCAYPEDFIEKALAFLKPGGILWVTTPNALMFRNHLPTFGQLQRREDRKFLEEKQFGPDGEDHLFLFTLSDLKLILPKGVVLKKAGYLGGTVLINRRTTFFLRVLPKSWLLGLERLVANVPVLNRLTCHGLYAVLEKNKTTQN